MWVCEKRREKRRKEEKQKKSQLILRGLTPHKIVFFKLK
jgi:hypothetical protein